MIEKITIRNFQKHQNISLEIDPAVTCITGPNDSGKSAIVRALFWLVFNRPSGNKFITWGKDNTIVKLVVDGRTIIRKKGKRSYYSLDGKKFKAFGTTVPPEITDLLKMERVNFQKQKDPVFWLSLSPQQVSKELNRIVDLGIIDSSLAQTGKEIRKSTIKMELLDEQLKDARKRRKELKWTLNAREELDKIVQKEVLIKNNTARIRVIESLISDVSIVTKRLEVTSKLAVLARGATVSAEKYVKADKPIKRLSYLIEQCNQLEEELCLNDQYLKKVKKMISMVKVCPICLRPMKS